MKRLACIWKLRVVIAEQVEAVRNYYTAQGMFGIPRKGECDYSVVLDLDLGEIRPERRGPKASAGSHRVAGSEGSVSEPAAKASC